MSATTNNNLKINTEKGICIFIDWYLPGYKAGGPIQSVANMVAQLSKHKTFYIVTRNTDYCDDTPYSNITPNIWTKHSDNVFVYYFSADKLHYKSIKNLLKENRFESIYLNGIFSLQFTLMPLRICKKLHLENIIVGARGMLAPSALSIKKNKKRFFLSFSKLLGLYNKISFHATNEDEKNYIQQIFGLEHNIFVAPNLAKVSSGNTFKTIAKIENQLSLINVARIAPEKNLLYALEVLLLVKSKITFNIYGPTYNEDYWKQCQQVMAAMPANITIQYHGAVDNNKVPQLISENHAMFMPTQGENFGHIILESLQAARPVIISNLTPWKNLEAQHCGYDLPLNNKQTFADVIESVAAINQQAFDNLCKSSFDFAHNFSANTADLNANKVMFGIQQ